MALNTIGCAIWAAGFVLAGSIAASAWTTIRSVFGRTLLAVGLVILAASALRKRHSS